MTPEELLELLRFQCFDSPMDREEVGNMWAGLRQLADDIMTDFEARQDAENAP